MINIPRILIILIIILILYVSNKIEICKKCKGEIKLVCLASLWFLQEPILGLKIFLTLVIGEFYLSKLYKNR